VGPFGDGKRRTRSDQARWYLSRAHVGACHLCRTGQEGKERPPSGCDALADTP
jgi:hypothetical protein